MISFDTPTVLFSSLLIEIVSTFVMVLLWLQNRKRFEGIKLWVINFSFQTIALILIILRGQISDWISIDLSNILVITGALLGLMGLEKFIGKRGRHIHNFIILVIFAFIHICFIYVKPDLAVRNLNTSLAMVIIFSQCSWLLLYEVKGDAKKIGFLTGVLFFGYCLINIARIIYIIIAEPTDTEYLNLSIFETSVLISFQILFILVTYSLVLMYNRRLLYDIVAQEEKYSKAFKSSPYAIILTSLSDGKIIEVNDKFFKITEYLPDEVMNKTTLELKIWNTDDDRLVIVKALSKNEKVHDLEFQFRKKSGRKFPGIISCEILTVNNESCILTSINDISIRKDAENEIKLNEARLEGLLRISNHKAKTVQEYLDFALDEALKLTQSQIGYIYYYDEEKKEFTLSFWSENIIVPGPIDEQQTVYPFELNGLLEETVRQKKPVVLNDFRAENPLNNESAVSDTSVCKCMTLPVFFDNQIVAVVVVANKETNYTATAVKQLELMMNSVWHITEQIKTEISLKETQAIFTAAMDYSPAGIAIAEAPSGLLKYVNQAGLLISNNSEKQILNKVDLHTYFAGWKIKHLDGTLYKPDEVPLARAIKYGEVNSMEFMISRENQDDKIVWANAAPVFDDEGKIKAGIVVFLDVTESKKAADAIKMSEEKFRNLFENSAVAKSMTGIDGTMEVNTAFCDMLGYTRDELKSKSWMEISHPDDFQVTEDNIRLLMEGKSEKVRFEKRFIHKNGNIIWADLASYLQPNRKGNPDYFITTLFDITYRKNAEESIRRSEEKLRAVLDATPFPVAVVDLQDETILLWSRSAVELFGHTAPTTKEWYLIAYPDPDYREEAVKRWKLFLKMVNKTGQAVNTGEYRITCKDGSERICELYATFLSDNLIVTFNDITERKLIEEKIHKMNEDLESRVSTRTAQLVASNKELEAFSYSVSHDLRAPLRAIHSFANILGEDYKDILDAEGRRITDIIKSSSVHLGKLIDDLLEFSRMGRSGINYSRINMTHLVSSVYQELTHEKEKGRVIFLVHKLPSISGDNTLMKQVVRNLISNALKYSSKNKIAEIEIGSDKNGDEIIYWVKDNGVGFDMQYMKKLFGVFQRLHSTRDFEGNGVGLAIVKRIILRHEGRVWAEGEVNKGARFYFALPDK